ncbi:MAG: hypothetical protein AAGA67_06675 [Cyanobacteria bacterium P01_F01_bin.153]
MVQYGQWDGYPEGVGFGLLEMLKSPGFLAKLFSALPKCRFLDPQGDDKAFWEDYKSRCPELSSDPDRRTEEQRDWWRTFCHRDLAEEVLANVAFSEESEILLRDAGWDDPGNWAEWRYTVDYKNDTLFVEDSYGSGWSERGRFLLSDLPSSDEFISVMKEVE